MTLGSQNGPESFHAWRFDGRKWEFRSRPLPCTRLVWAGLDLPRTGEPGLLGLGPSALETMMLPVAVERSVSPAVLVIDRSSAELAGPSWMAGRRTRGPSPCPRAWTWHLSTPPWGLDMAKRTWRVVCWLMSQTYRSVVRPTWQTLVVESPWPSSTPWSESGRLWTGNPPGYCVLLADGREPT